MAGTLGIDFLQSYHGWKRTQCFSFKWFLEPRIDIAVWDTDFFHLSVTSFHARLSLIEATKLELKDIQAKHKKLLEWKKKTDLKQRKEIQKGLFLVLTHSIFCTKCYVHSCKKRQIIFLNAIFNVLLLKKLRVNCQWLRTLAINCVWSSYLIFVCVRNNL